MERTRNESGSALIIATVVVMVVVGMSAALLSDTVFKARATENAVEADEDMLLCLSEQEDEPLHYVCKECFLRGL